MLLCAQKFIDCLKEKDISFDIKELPDDEIMVRVGFFNRVTNFIFGGEEGKYVQMVTLFESVPVDRVAAVLFECNKLNSTYKWLKFYIDNDNDLMVDDDAIVTPENAGDECFELLMRRLNILNDVKSSIMRAIYMDI